MLDIEVLVYLQSNQSFTSQRYMIDNKKQINTHDYEKDYSSRNYE